MSDFDEWCDNNYIGAGGAEGYAQSAWNHQQARIDELEASIEKACDNEGACVMREQPIECCICPHTRTDS